MNKFMLILLLAILVSGCTSRKIIEEKSTQQVPETITPSASGPVTPTQEQSASIESPNHQNMTELKNTSFGFADETGKYIIIVEQEEDVEVDQTSIQQLNQAMGENSDVLTIRYVKHQSRNDQDNGRQAAHNFNNLEGELFEIVEGTAKPDASYYLINDNEFLSESLIAIHPVEPQDPAAIIKDEIMITKNRTIANSWQIAALETGEPIFLVRFERQEDQMLASLVMKQEEKWVFMDYPATYNEGSTWRVDDGGEISPDMFSFLFAAHSDKGIMLGVKWLGAEGENSSILQQTGVRFVETGINSSRYLSPM